MLCQVGPVVKNIAVLVIYYILNCYLAITFLALFTRRVANFKIDRNLAVIIPIIIMVGLGNNSILVFAILAIFKDKAKAEENPTALLTNNRVL